MTGNLTTIIHEYIRLSLICTRKYLLIGNDESCTTMEYFSVYCTHPPCTSCIQARRTRHVVIVYTCVLHARYTLCTVNVSLLMIYHLSCTPYIVRLTRGIISNDKLTGYNVYLALYGDLNTYMIGIHTLICVLYMIV